MAESAQLPLISIVIPTHNRRALMLAMLQALEAQQAGTPQFELIAVADGCKDGTAAMLADYRAPFPITVVELPGSGPAVARNAGAAAAHADLLLFLDDDVLPLPGAVAAHWRAHQDQPDGAVIGPYPPAPHASEDVFRLRIRGWWTRHFAALEKPGHRFSFCDLLTGNLSMPRSLWDEIGGLDPQFARAREDLELGARLIARGIPLRYAPAAFGWHHEHATSSLKSACRRAFEEGRSDVRMLLKHPHLHGALDIARHASRRRKRVARFLLTDKRSAWLERLIPLPLALLSICRALHLHAAYDRLFSLVHRYHYHRGAVAGVDGKWWKLAGAVPPDAAPPLTIDLGDGIEQAERAITAARPASVQLTLNGVDLGMLPEQAGAEPWHGRHLRPALLDRHGPALLAMQFGKDDPHAGRPKGWQLYGVRDFHAQHMEFRRQWGRAGV
jgi:GT2 family glycosyltransferase